MKSSVMPENSESGAKLWRGSRTKSLPSAPTETTRGALLPIVTPISFTAPPACAERLKVLSFCRRSQMRMCPSWAPVAMAGVPPPPGVGVPAPPPAQDSGRASMAVMWPLWPFSTAMCSARQASQTLTLPLRSPLATTSSAQMNSMTGASWPVQQASSVLARRSQARRVLSYPEEIARWCCAWVRTREMEPRWPVRSTHATPLEFHRQSLLSSPPEMMRPSRQCDTVVTHSVCPKRFV
mmetsp:Transcript_94287/g.281357  ORF Transcript_94287/g.281357 Transcript_94287/m.281357 type:complete len:238 (+) Transcript_94287:290-1003(+)